MKREEKKCPSCGHVFKDGQTYCPNCDLFVPTQEQEINDTPTNNSVPVNEFTEKHDTIDEEPTIPTFKHRNMKSSDTSSVDTTQVNIDEDTVIEQNTPSKEIVGESIVVEETTVEETPKEEPVHRVEEVVLETVVTPPTTQSEPVEQKIESTPTPPTPPTSNNGGKGNKDKNNKTVTILIVIIAILVVFGGGYIYYSHNQQTKFEEQIKLTSTTEKAIKDLYLPNSNDVFLKVGISSEDFKNVEEKVQDLKGTDQYADLNEQLMHAQGLFNKEKAINDSFKTPVMSGDQLNKEAYVVNDTKLNLEKIDPEKNGFDKLYNEAIDEALAQKKALKDFDDTLEKLYRDDTVVKEPNLRIYDKAVEQLKAIKDPEVRKQYEPILAKVKEEIDKQNSEIEAKRAQEEREEQERLANEQAYQEQLAREEANKKEQEKPAPTAPKENNTNNKRWGNREDSNIDLSNDAWAWAPGVEQQFISEVISRGYVVEGGYSLVPKYVENGEGFYDLYATTNSKLFPKSKPEEFPLYVVTVNVKTGWFKGNGPN